ncbi:uncharacterized protein BDCG_00841 [Blastomyces dermatitidis ER-3]|uniref:Uncharacterized protein n=1 Tax=Ajellomyces dermatitidis (strain ER-3 / ATCC MYA-2586) TaxID=559297 RepID=A0ABP2ELC9_AJEDR|nr:uncharacterized protein BDCG_00841 [Blastomyces dermatitidis ER-3]EEQ84036.1 hypothetical protein BDCG_00841 [Blastomyces dermatitidis ER-3]
MTGLPAPAPPILASTLLDSSFQRSNDNRHSGQEEPGRVESALWDLTRDIEEGISLTPNKSVLSCGMVIGISGLQPAAVNGSREGVGDDIRPWVNEFWQHILTTLLCKYPTPQAFPRAFVIQYFDSRPLSPHVLYSSLQQRLPDLAPEDIESILENIQTRRVYDFDELLEAVSQISDILFELQQRQKTHPEKKEKGHSYSAPVLLLIEGIDQSLEEIIRRSNPVAGHARLIPLLRTLTVLSRTYASFLSVIIVNSIALPHIRSAASSAQTATLTPAPHDTDAGQQPPRQPASGQLQQQRQYSPEVAVRSIFANIPRGVGRLSKASPTPYYFSVLARSLDQGCDVHLLVSQIQEKMVIEVAKHRVGAEVGRWCDL